MFRPAIRHDPALVDDRDPVAALRFFHQVGGEKDGHILLVAQPVKRLPEIDPRPGIEPGGRLVEQEQLGAMEQALGDLDPPLQAAGKCLDQLAGAIAQIEFKQEMIDPRPQRRARQAVEAPLMGEVFAHLQFLVEARRLENHPEPAAQRARVAPEIEPENAGRTACWPNESGKNAEERRLASAVGSEEAEDFARRDPERDLVERDPLAVTMGQLACDEGGSDFCDSRHRKRG